MSPGSAGRVCRAAWPENNSGMPRVRSRPDRPPEFRSRVLRGHADCGVSANRRAPVVPRADSSDAPSGSSGRIRVAVGAIEPARRRRFNAVSWADGGPIPLARCCPVRPPLPMPPVGVSHSRNAGFFPIRESRSTPGCAGFARPYDPDAWDCDAGERIAASPSTPRRGRGGSGHVPRSCEFASRGSTSGRNREAVREVDLEPRRQVRAEDREGCAPIREPSGPDSRGMAGGREFDRVWRDVDRRRIPCPAGSGRALVPTAGGPLFRRYRTFVARHFEPAQAKVPARASIARTGAFRSRHPSSASVARIIAFTMASRLSISSRR